MRPSAENVEVGGHQKIGRPKLRWSDVIRKYTNEKRVKKEAHDRITWRLKTRFAEPKIGKRPKQKEFSTSALECHAE